MRKAGANPPGGGEGYQSMHGKANTHKIVEKNLADLADAAARMLDANYTEGKEDWKEARALADLLARIHPTLVGETRDYVGKKLFSYRERLRNSIR